MKILTVIQGSKEWHEARATHFCASDAPAMMGVVGNKTRSELLKEKHTGMAKEHSAFVEDVIFARGHAAEAKIRPHIASVLGDDLFPVVLEEGHLLASLDGITMDDETIFEHKLWGEALATQIEVGELTPEYYWQLEHQLYVSKAKRVIFVCSDGTPAKCVHMFYEPVEGRAETLLAGWKQFDIDLFAYNAPPPDPVVEKMALMALPTLAVQIVGEVTTSNLPAYRNSALEFIKSINTDLQNDQDFADAEQTVKFCETAEKNIEAVKAQAIAQTATIDELFRSLDQIADAMRQKRLMLDRLVKTRKEQIRTEIVTEGRNKWIAHLAELNTRLRRISVTVSTPDFATAIKGKRTLSSLRDAVDSALTAAKIAATQQADLFASRLVTIDDLAKDHAFLVRDLASLVLMTPDTLSAVIKQRIADHQAEQDRKAEATRQAEAARVQREQDAAAARAQQPAPAATAAPIAAAPTTIVHRDLEVPPARTSPAPVALKPSAAEMVEVLARHYSVQTTMVLEWINATNFEGYAESLRGAPF